jgi:hypothetical protein
MPAGGEKLSDFPLSTQDAGSGDTLVGLQGGHTNVQFTPQQAFAGGNFLSAVQADQTLSGGWNVVAPALTMPPIGILLAIDCGRGPLQQIFNTQAFTIAAPQKDGQTILQIINTGTAGQITFDTGYTVGGATGSALTTNPNDIFSIFIWRINGISQYYVIAAQGTSPFLSASQTNQTFSGGYNVVTDTLPAGNLTVNAGLGPLQTITNNAAFTISPPTQDGQTVLQIVNGATPGGVTFQTGAGGFTVGSYTGDVLSTNPGDKFSVFIWRINGVSQYYIFAAQGGVTGAFLSSTATDQILSGGWNNTPRVLTTGNVTVDCGLGPLQRIVNNGNFTITAPANDGQMVLQITNGASAGTVTFGAGFTVGNQHGDPFTTTNGNVFSVMIWRINGVSQYYVMAAQGGPTGPFLSSVTTDQTLSGGWNVTADVLTPGNITIDCGLGPLQRIVNNGNFNINAPTNDGSTVLQITNGATAGTPTPVGFTVGNQRGDTFDTTNGHIFSMLIWRINGVSQYYVYAAQGGATGTFLSTTATDQVLSGGWNVVTDVLTTGNVTIDCGAGPLQRITNNGNFNITAPANDGSTILQITNGATAGTPTPVGFTVGINHGDPFTTTNGSIFSVFIWRVNGVSQYYVVAAQGGAAAGGIDTTPFLSTISQGSTYAQTRNSADRWSDVVNVLDFGANPNGATTYPNGTAWDGGTQNVNAIQNAINAMAGTGRGIIYFPPGSYIVNSKINMVAQTPIRLLGASATKSSSNLAQLLANQATPGRVARSIGSGFNGFILDEVGSNVSSQAPFTIENLMIRNTYFGNGTTYIANIKVSGLFKQGDTSIVVTNGSGGNNLLEGAIIFDETFNTAGATPGYVGFVKPGGVLQNTPSTGLTTLQLGDSRGTFGTPAAPIIGGAQIPSAPSITDILFGVSSPTVSSNGYGFTATTTNLSNSLVVNSITTAGAVLGVGMSITGPNIAANTTITSIGTSGGGVGTYTISIAATGSTSGAMNAWPYYAGDTITLTLTNAFEATWPGGVVTFGPYSVVAGDTGATVAAQFRTLINASTLMANASIVASGSGTDLRLTQGGAGNIHTVSVSTFISWSKTGTGNELLTPNPATMTSDTLTVNQGFFAGATWTTGISGQTALTMNTASPGFDPGQYYIWSWEWVTQGSSPTPVCLGVTSDTLWPFGSTSMGITNHVPSGRTSVYSNAQYTSGSRDLLMLTPVSGAVRHQGSLCAEVRNCTLQGMICCTFDSTATLDFAAPSASPYGSGTICNTSCPQSAASKAIIGTMGVSLGWNSTCFDVDVSGAWIGARFVSDGVGWYGGRIETCAYGIILGGQLWNAAQSNSFFSNPAVSGFFITDTSMEGDWIIDIVNEAGASVTNGTISNIAALHNHNMATYGLFLYGSCKQLVVSAVNCQGLCWNQSFAAWGSPAQFWFDDSIAQGSGGSPNGSAQYLSVISSTGDNSLGLLPPGGAVGTYPQVSWHTPNQAVWGSCINCNNPPLAYPFSKLPIKSNITGGISDGGGVNAGQILNCTLFSGGQILGFQVGSTLAGVGVTPGTMCLTGQSNSAGRYTVTPAQFIAAGTVMQLYPMRDGDEYVITDSQLGYTTTNTIAVSAWSSATTYASGNQVLASDNFVYTATAATVNLNKNPANNANPTFWTQGGYSPPFVSNKGASVTTGGGTHRVKVRWSSELLNWIIV